MDLLLHRFQFLGQHQYLTNVEYSKIPEVLDYNSYKY